jgi:hypothetical protein
VPPEETVDELLQTLQTLEAVTGGRAPSDIVGIGAWPKDRKELTEPLQRLAQEGNVAIEDSEYGVTISTNE